MKVAPDHELRRPKTLPQVLALSSASIASFACGNLFSFPSPAIPKLLMGEYNFTIEEVSYLTVVPSVTMILTSVVFCKLVDKVGRKRTLLATGFFQIISWLLIAFSKDLHVIYLSRVFSGFGDAVLFAALPAYIAEVTTPSVRDIYGNALIVAMFAGQFAVNCVGFYASLRTTGLVMLAFPLMFLATFSFMPETPYYFLMVGDQASAKESLKRLRGSGNVDDEIKQLDRDVRRQLAESGSFKDLWAIPSNRRALMIANLARAFQQFSGISALVTYSQFIFAQAGSDISSGHSAMIVSGLLAGVHIFSNILTDKIGRRRSMIISCSGCAAATFSIALYFYLQTYTDVNLSSVTWFPIFGAVLYVLVFSIGLGVVPTVVLGELFSAGVRKHSAMISNIIFGIFMGGISKLFQFLMTTYGLCVPFFFFSLCGVVGCVSSYFIIPETKGKTLEEIQQILKGN